MSRVAASQLRHHPATPAHAVCDLRASVERSRDGALDVAFRLAAVVSRIRLPAPGPTQPGSRLWEHTCFELFVATDEGPAYHEFNLAPSREWAIYAFRDYRDASTAPCDLLAPAISVASTEEIVELTARLWLPRRPPSQNSVPLRVGLAAVIEDDAGARSYWALRHPREKPDFHHPDSFVLRIEPPARG
jgi:hypothetical protein